ncbi:AsnC family transcriptional regulator [Proteinivorax tanatarense]|uniref:siroheme decarboxylase n=1 Tax=Proteinivorax tanatarense TaxID=1260629 RepID=A0AAU7VJH3_9FIRM
MDYKDKAILNIIQHNFPINNRPYLEIAAKLDLTEEEVLSRIGRLKNKGLIRRIGAIFDSKKLGYKSTLCALKTDNEHVEKVSNFVNSYPGVTHNYLRDHHFNIWFTLISSSDEEMERILIEIEKAPDVIDLINLPAKKLFKLNVNFQIKERE